MFPTDPTRGFFYLLIDPSDTESTHFDQSFDILHFCNGFHCQIAVGVEFCIALKSISPVFPVCLNVLCSLLNNSHSVLYRNPLVYFLLNINSFGSSSDLALCVQIESPTCQGFQFSIHF